ncbi:hypothetical protein Kpol_1055p86 [Vanderwaltozyma polyspora DSM 70294]|uniref:Vacuolar protein 14 C-terminal Fig4-binding domain-containing protein n=1 Tax=Vanderwaltozyma polyspora (strain ATCC 22028 / DSM 70294 / BCRC 21397 / CBS 2163 / NBRC 10782 / NRRL Y-8283 / UCD 57-17) TaxID=436907 RepID=A7TGF9_VANPO|nr:uncharacterized protein Kpol_1055p86 [Vanderwaltozyma polyspora DSM 70294]EDO18729.1 hypothetical protein Kpol_1055p86 [Vanderwaltozyma polyspora DSM 70294]
MDKSIAKGLGDKLYEKRKATALELQKLVTQCVIDGDYARVDKIIDELCRDYAYALHQPTARNAGLMGLAAAAIALGTNNVGRYLHHILPPVLACFGDQNDQVRFYACESLYNIAKIAKGEILVYFNEVFDVLCKISADTETSVRGAAELLDRLIKDIVAERASNYISVVNNDPKDMPPATKVDVVSGNVYREEHGQDDEQAFSLPKFIPLLSERIYAINPDTRVFLVDWLKVLLNTPELELISYLPSFLGGLFTFLGDSHKDVRTVTHELMDLLLQEVERISKLQDDLARKSISSEPKSDEDTPVKKNEGTLIAQKKKHLLDALGKLSTDSNEVASPSTIQTNNTIPVTGSIPTTPTEEEGAVTESTSIRDGEEYILGQDIHLNFPDIIEILVNNLGSSEYEVRLASLHWIESLMDLSSGDFIPYFSKILSLLLKLLGDSDNRISESAQIVNSKFMKLCANYDHNKNPNAIAYGSIVNSLTLQFFDSKVDAKIACLDWLLLIHKKAPNQIFEHNDSMFLTLLKSLSDNDTRLIEKALCLLNCLCVDSKDDYLKKFLGDLLNLLKNDPKLFKTRANYIMRQLCARLSAERIYKVLSSLLDSRDDIMFSKMMIQILSTNLMTANEVDSLRKKLRKGEDGMFFNTLFKWWCYNPVSVISLCLVSENYDLAYSVLQAYVNYDLGLSDLVQLDVLVQLLESPVFTRMRLQLLEQQKYPFLYKSLYGILMILPQSKAFDILNKRLSSITVWASQNAGSSNFYKSNRSSSNLSVGTESSQRSVSQSRHHYQELLDHFNKICSQASPNVNLGTLYEPTISILNGTVLEQDKNPLKQSIPNELEVTSFKESENYSVDGSSVLIKNEANRDMTRTSESFTN